MVRTEGPGGTRRGGIERFYRSLELPFIDNESWALVPLSVRAISTWNFLRQVLPRLRGDLEEASDDASYKSELSCATFQFDEEGWRLVAAAINEQFAHLYEEQENARLRVLHSGEELVLADVFLIAFEPLSSAAHSVLVDQLAECQREPMAAFPQRLAPILQDDMRLEIVSEANIREISVPQFHREVGGARRPVIGRRFKGLESGGWLAQGRIEINGVRLGANEQFFRATKPAIRNYDFSADPLNRLAGTESWQAFEGLCELARESLISGTFDMRTDRFLCWSLIRLDRQGWANVIADIDFLSRFISEEEEQARIRMSKSGERPIPMTVGLAAFEAPKGPDPLNSAHPV